MSWPRCAGRPWRLAGRWATRPTRRTCCSVPMRSCRPPSVGPSRRRPGMAWLWGSPPGPTAPPRMWGGPRAKRVGQGCPTELGQMMVGGIHLADSGCWLPIQRVPIVSHEGKPYTNLSLPSGSSQPAGKTGPKRPAGYGQGLESRGRPRGLVRGCRRPLCGRGRQARAAGLAGGQQGCQAGAGPRFWECDWRVGRGVVVRGARSAVHSDPREAGL